MLIRWLENRLMNESTWDEEINVLMVESVCLIDIVLKVDYETVVLDE